MFVNYRNHHYFSLEEQNFMETLASTAAVAIRNRRLLRPNIHEVDPTLPAD
jgi:GAF domain-containing protein